MNEFEKYKSELNQLYIQEQFSKEEYELSLEQSGFINEQVIQEMIFNKDDLQDPKTLEKILEKMKRREPIFETLAAIGSFLTFCLSIAISIITTGAFTILLSPFFIILSIIVFMYINTIPQTQFRKDNEKFKKKVIKLKEKTQEKLNKETDPKKKSKYQEIIKNCDKVLKAIEDGIRKEDEFDENDKQALKSTYTDLVRFLEYPFDFGWEKGIYDIALLAQILGLKPQDIQNKIKRTKFRNSEKTVYDCFVLMFGKNTVDTGLNDPNNFEYDENFIIKYKSIMNMKAIETGSNDDNIDFVAQNGIFYMLTTDNDVISGDMFKFTDDSSYDSEWYKTNKNFMKMLIEVDKELGYYLLSDCPPGLKKKKFPL